MISHSPFLTQTITILFAILLGFPVSDLAQSSWIRSGPPARMYHGITHQDSSLFTSNRYGIYRSDNRGDNWYEVLVDTAYDHEPIHLTQRVFAFDDHWYATQIHNGWTTFVSNNPEQQDWVKVETLRLRSVRGLRMPSEGWEN